MKIQTNVKAGGIETSPGPVNHNARQLRVKSGVKAGGIETSPGPVNHNATQVRSLHVQSGVKASGGIGSD